MNNSIATRVQKIIYRCTDKVILYLYKKNMGRLVSKIRNKDKINVLFVVFELGTWKTERLYWEMKKNPRFVPQVVVTPSIENYLATDVLVKYLKGKKIEYVLANGEVANLNQLNGDIVFYEKPYDGCYPSQYWYKNNLNSLFCYVFYSHHCVYKGASPNAALYEAVWLHFFESQSAMEELRPIIHNKRNLLNTGYPSVDDLLSPITENPWKPQSKKKKRIIYAPHHTIGDLHVKEFAYSTFLEFGELILQLAIKYKDDVQWAFKPHPRLYDKLLTIWGKEKTDEYYSKWSELDNCQFENGLYSDLFKTSDAMIHDSGSFIVEYMATRNPILYLVRGDLKYHTDNMLPYAKLAFDLHYKAYNCAQIEEFVQNVIKDVDPIREERENYFQKYLLPPHGKTACENIMNAILGEEEYSKI